MKILKILEGINTAWESWEVCLKIKNLCKKIVGAHKENNIFQSGNYFLPYGCIGRNTDSERVILVLKSLNPPVVVRGIAGVGKTAFCSYVYEQLYKEDNAWYMPFVNLTACRTLADFYEAFVVALGLEHENIDNPSQYIMGQLLKFRRDRLIVYLDNWEDLQNALDTSGEWDKALTFVNGLFKNNIRVLISSQETPPNGWIEFKLDPLDSDDGRKLFLNLLAKRGKYPSLEEKSVLDELLKKMEDHPLTIVLTASLVDGSFTDMKELLYRWKDASSKTENENHRSLKVALQMSYNSLKDKEENILLWGILSMFDTDLPTEFLDCFTNEKKRDDWIEAKRNLYRRSLISYSENNSKMHMLLAVKQQWRKFVSDKQKEECLLQWAKAIPTIIDTLEIQEMSLYKNSFFCIVNRLIEKCYFELADECIVKMENIYEASAELAYKFLNKLPEIKFSTRTQGIINKQIGNILRLKEKGTTENSAVYYEKALKCFQDSGDEKNYTEVLNNIGQNIYWNEQNPEKAMEYFIESEREARNINNKIIIAEALKNQGIVFTDSFQNYQKAKDCLEEAYDYYAEEDNYIGIAHTIKRKGNILWLQGEIENAVLEYEEALRYYKRAHYWQGQGDTCAHLCRGYLKLGYIGKLKKIVIDSEKLVDNIPYETIKSDLCNAIEEVKSKIY